MPRYAAETSVSSERSRAEIETTLSRYGADSFMYAWHGQHATIAFRMNERLLRFEVGLPDRLSEEFTLTPTKQWSRSTRDAHREWEKACRQRWRALALVVKAKLEAVECGISEFETEFLGHIVLPDGRTVEQWVRPAVAQAYESGAMPTDLRLMLPPEEGRDRRRSGR